MDRSRVMIPFGLLFEETAPPEHAIQEVEYDEEMGLSLVRCDNGKRIPFVELPITGGSNISLGTATITEVKSETTDTDPEDDRAISPRRSILTQGTQTLTRVRPENTDQD